MKSKQKILMHFSIMLYFFVYFISTLYNSTYWGDILSPIGAVISFIMLFYVYKKTIRMNSVWLFFSLGALSWAIADIAWAICELIFKLDPNNITAFNLLYLFPNIFIVAAGAIFLIKLSKKLNFIQLLLDILAISLSSINLFWILLMHSSINIFFQNINNIFLFLYMLCDCIILNAVVIFLFSVRKGKITTGIYLTLFAGVLYSCVDLIYSNVYFYNLYVPNSLIDSGYILSILLIAYGGLLVLKQYDSSEASAFYLELENSGANRKSLILLVFPVIYLIFKGFQFNQLIFLISIFVLYQVLSGYVQNAIKNEKLLQKEMNMNSILEEKISERTNELLSKNKELDYISKHDYITNIYNGWYFRQALDGLLSRGDGCEPIALLYIDLDRFKTINDTYGHDIGDKILIEISKRLTMTNYKNNILARLGGDEFVMIIYGSYRMEEIQKITSDMIKLCNKPINIDNYQFRVTLSIGISGFPKDGNTRDTLMKYADIAMYDAKSKGYNHYSFFNAYMHEKISEKHEIEILLRNADYSKEFQLYYQPQINLKSEKLVGVEALIRWNSPVKGFIRPDKFIKVAEEIGCIDKISDWVMNEAARQSYVWNTKYGNNLKVGINISPKQLGGIDFINKLSTIISVYNLSPEWLDIEITENVAMKGESNLEEIFSSLSDLSISTSIDDFGTGYSSLSYIQQFSFDRLKIAKELIDNISEDFGNKSIVEAIVMMSKSLRLITIAEGVETYEQLQILKYIGCDEVQGYIFSKPLPAQELEDKYLAKKS